MPKSIDISVDIAVPSSDVTVAYTGSLLYLLNPLLDPDYDAASIDVKVDID